jgi:hypothetical protein
MLEFKKQDRVIVIDNQFTRKNKIANKTGTVVGIFLYHVVKVQLDEGMEIMLETSELKQEPKYNASSHNKSKR